MDGRLTRRGFLQLSALSIGGLGIEPFQPGSAGSRVALVVPPGDELAAAPQVQWAVRELASALTQRGMGVRRVGALAAASSDDLRVLVAGPGVGPAAAILQRADATLPRTPESLALVAGTVDGKATFLAGGRDVRGLMYAVLELAERIRYADDPLSVFRHGPTVEEPLNAVRAIGRPFVSDVEDTSWFNDREFWPAYFAMLAYQRVNRFHLSLGFGYDTLRWVTDAYMLYPYPFLVSVPGHAVRAVGLPDDERDRNLDMLRFISREAVAHGLDFQLGVWTHGYVWADSPNANYTIAGVTPGNQAAYSRDALTAVLQACPSITGVTLRTHYESGVREGSYAFWKTIFEGIPRAGRRLELELHVKGLDQKMVDAALALGLPVRLSPKYWAEHVGLPYQQSAIRELERPHVDTNLDPFSALSFGSRNHTRYGYADFLQEGRPYGVMYRVFPGTHKFLLWGDPVTAAAHARAFQFCGSDGAELLEPLAFKGRRGSGRQGGRCAYRDVSLNPRRDWEKYLYTYLLWGRLLYNPDSPPDTWRRLLRRQYGPASQDVEAALGSATRILPLITTAHLPSAAQDTYSPEFYTNQSVCDPDAASPYGDTPQPKVFARVSPLDPEMFATIDEHVGQLLAGEHHARYSPVEAAQWLDDLAETSAASLAQAERRSTNVLATEFRRAAVDIRMQIGIGRFFAAKLRAGALYSLYEKSGDRGALESSLVCYRQARDVWARFSDEAKAVYLADITFGPLPHQGGHWHDRLPAIDTDIAALDGRLAALASGGVQPDAVTAAVARILGRPARGRLACRHVPPRDFARGASVELALVVTEPSSPSSVVMCYRHVNQAERYDSLDMRLDRGTYRATIPAAYTASPFPLQYYFQVRQERDGAWLYPGIGPDLISQPYFVLRHARGR